ncbi:MAG: hypothetical protein WDN09_02225 [bacterium]
MSALLNANALQQKSQDMRSIMDSLSFIMEEMSRNLRTGYAYHCFGQGESVSPAVAANPKSCQNGYAIAFENQFGDKDDDGDQWAYKIQSQDGGKTFNIYKSVNGGASFIQLNPSEVSLKSFSRILRPRGRAADRRPPAAARRHPPRRHHHFQVRRDAVRPAVVRHRAADRHRSIA